MPVNLKIKIKERGAVPRGFKKYYSRASKTAWHESGVYYHTQLRDKRFTREHARKAGYKLRQGEQPGITRNKFFGSYMGRKLRRFHHQRPLEFSGETRRAVQSARITSTSSGSRIAYPGARKFNFRASPNAPNMAAEFRTVLPEEIREIAGHYDKTLEDRLQAEKESSTRNI